MNCKFCNAELPEEVTLCPACGQENAEELTEEVAAAEMAETDEEVTGEIAEETTEEATEEVTEEATEECTEQMPAEETEEPAKPKRKLWVRILAIICGVAILAVLAGSLYFGTNPGPKAESYTVSAAKAEKSRDLVVATAGDYQLTNSELQAFYWQSVNDFYNYYGNYMDLSTLGLDLSQPLDQQFYDQENGITWQQYFLDIAIQTWHRYAALAQTGKEEGFTISEESREYLERLPQDMEDMAVTYGYKDAADMLYQDMGPACDVAGYLRYIELNYYVGQYYDTVYATMEPSLEEMQTYYTENKDTLEAMGIIQNEDLYVNARHILVTPKDGEVSAETGEIVYSEASWEACRQQAQAILDEWKAGDADEASFSNLATQYSEDPGSQSTGGLYTNIYKGQMVEPFENWCFDESRTYGDTGLVQTSYGYHVMFFVNSEAAWITNLRSQLVAERSTAFVEDAVANVELENNMKNVVLCDAPDAE